MSKNNVVLTYFVFQVIYEFIDKSGKINFSANYLTYSLMRRTHYTILLTCIQPIHSIFQRFKMKVNVLLWNAKSNKQKTAELTGNFSDYKEFCMLHFLLLLLML